MTKLGKQLRGMTAEDIASEIEFARSQIATSLSETGKREMARNLAAMEAEVRRREHGGRRGPDRRETYVSDGERFAEGLEPKDDNP